MMSTTLATILGLIGLLAGLYPALSGWLIVRFFKEELAKKWPVPEKLPKVALIAPCKDLDPDFRENMRMLPLQNYPNYEIFFVTVDAQDPTYPVLTEIASQSQVPAHVLLGGFSKKRCQKLDNMIKAIESLDESFEVLAFVDSDARITTHWLHDLVAPLNDPKIGATTSYRWYTPIPGKLISYLLCLWTGVQFSNFYINRYVAVWGGTMALRRQTFEDLEIRKWWENALSDDCVLNDHIKKSGLRVEFVTAAMTSLSTDYPLREILIFATRQCVIGKHTLQEVWYGSLALLTGMHALVCLGLYQLFTALQTGAPIHWSTWGMLSFVVGGMIQAVFFIHAIQIIARDRPREDPLKGRYHWAVFSPLAYLFVWLTLAASAFTDKFVWREIYYQMVNAHETIVYKYPERFQ